jgi:ankyrin repeat protein
MSNQINKDNFSSLVPCIRVNDVKAAMEYYICRLGFCPRYYIKGAPDSGGVSINNLSVDFISGDIQTTDTSLNFLVNDVDELFRFYDSRNADIIFEPQDTGGMRLFGIRDLNGYKLFFYRWSKSDPNKDKRTGPKEKQIPERFKDSLMDSAVNAVRKGDTEVLKKLLNVEPTLVHRTVAGTYFGNKRLTLLHVLIDYDQGRLGENSAEVARLLINSGAEVDTLDGINKGNTPLQMLCSLHGGHDYLLDVAIVLLQAGANPRDPISNDWGMSAFACAVLNNQNKVAELMFPKVERQGFAWIAGLGKLDLIKTFFAPKDTEDYKAGSKHWTAEEADKDFDLNKDRSILVAAFLLACINGKNSVIKFLLEKGVNINIHVPGSDFAGIGGTGLHWAAYHGHFDTVKFLIKNGADINSEDDVYSLTPAGWAGRNGHYEIADYLQQLKHS